MFASSAGDVAQSPEILHKPLWVLTAPDMGPLHRHLLHVFHHGAEALLLLPSSLPCAKDVITLGGCVPQQGIGNGLPLAAVVTTPEVAQTLAQRLHFNTYGGNPVCSAGGRAVLRAVDEDGIQANAAKVR